MNWNPNTTEKKSPDHIIQWIFEKIFDQLTMDGAELTETPFIVVWNKTFGNVLVHQLIHRLTDRSVEEVHTYLEDYQQKFLFMKLKKKIDVQILLGSLDQVKKLFQIDYQFSPQSIKLAVLNNRLDILEYIGETNPATWKQSNELLMYCAEFSYEPMYYFLRERFGLVPNIFIYQKSVLGISLGIIKNISERISLSANILELAFQTNQTTIMMFLVEEAIKEGLPAKPHLASYPILNENFELVAWLETKNWIVWHHELYYAALLSGSMAMVELVESRIPSVHDKRILDMSRTRKGRSSLLLEDMIYHADGKKYFAHTMNYAIQSGSMEILRYVYAKGYGAAPSNVVTTIKQGTPEMLKFILDLVQEHHRYFIHYVGINSYVPDKMVKAQILVESKIDLVTKPTVSILKKEAIHLELIGQTVKIPEDGIVDPDYLMKYQMFFIPRTGSKLNQMLINLTRIYLVLGLDERLVNLFSQITNTFDKQLAIDALYLFGTVIQIQKFYPTIGLKCSPSTQIIMETMCYCQIGKLCYLYHQQLLSKELVDQLNPVATVLGDPHLLAFFQKISGEEFNSAKYIVLSGNIKLIEHLLDGQKDNCLPEKILKSLFLTENLNLIKKSVRFADPKRIQALAEWAREEDLLEVGAELESIINHLC